MAERESLSRLSLLALRKRHEGLAKVLPPLSEILRGSLMQRYLTCGNPSCKCARGERHGPVWYLSVTLDQSHRSDHPREGAPGEDLRHQPGIVTAAEAPEQIPKETTPMSHRGLERGAVPDHFYSLRDER